jgi:hypothetical protein
MSEHLSSEQISHWIAGERDTRQARHLRECAECSAELGRAESFFAALGASLRHWGDQHMGVNYARPPRVRLWIPIAAALSLAVVFTAIYDQRPPRHSDDALLDHIDAALSRSLPESIEPLTRLLSDRSETREP